MYVLERDVAIIVEDIDVNVSVVMEDLIDSHLSLDKRIDRLSMPMLYLWNLTG